MASNTDYLRYNNFCYYGLLVSFNGMNDSMVMTEIADVINLANFLIHPPALPSLFVTPRDWLSSLIFFPFNVNAGIESPSEGNLMIGGINTASSSYPVTVQTCYASRIFWLGEYKVEPHFNNFADYNGYTKIQIFLPLLGIVDIPTNDVMGKYMQIRLSVDPCSGMGVYYIGTSDVHIPVPNGDVTTSDHLIKRIIASYSFQIGYNIPIGSSDAPQVYRNIIGGAVKAVGTVAGAYAVSNFGGAVGTTTTETVRKVRNPATGRLVTGSKTATVAIHDSTNYQFGKSVTECFEYGSQALTNMHISSQTDRVNNPACLDCSSESVHIIISRPKLQSVDDDYNHIYGQPLGKTMALSELSGYTEISNIHLEGEGFNTATHEEMLMIMQDLSRGVIL